MFSYFIRTTTDAGGTIPAYILAVLAVWGVLYGCLTAVTDRKITWHLFLVLAFQVVLLMWYCLDIPLLLEEGLPFYHCRIVSLLILYAFYKKKEKLMTYTAWLGLFGALMAYAVNPKVLYVWPHLTYITFVGYHLNLMIIGLLLLRRHCQNLSLSYCFNQSVKINAVIYLLNLFLYTNYGYFKELPAPFPKNVPAWLVASVMAVLMGINIYSINRYCLRENGIKRIYLKSKAKADRVSEAKNR